MTQAGPKGHPIDPVIHAGVSTETSQGPALLRILGENLFFQRSGLLKSCKSGVLEPSLLQYAGDLSCEYTQGRPFSLSLEGRHLITTLSSLN